MRILLSSLIPLFVIAGLACSHKEIKSEGHSDIQPPAPVVKSAAGAPIETKGFVAPRKLTCAVNGDSRILEVRDKNKGCEFVYTKAGKEGVVASSINGGTHYCEKALEKLRDRLTGAGFACK